MGDAIESAIKNDVLLVIAGVLFALILLGLSWVAIPPLVWQIIG